MRDILQLFFGAALLGAIYCAPAFAETRIVVGEGSSDACWSTRESSLKWARLDASNDAHRECRALGSGWTFSGMKHGGYEQCEQCGKSSEFRCKVTQATYLCTNMQKERAEAAAKKRAEEQAAAAAAKAKADSEKAERELAKKVAQEKADREKAERERQRKIEKEKADQARALREAKIKADKEKAEAQKKAGRDKAEQDRALIKAKAKADQDKRALDTERENQKNIAKAKADLARTEKDAKTKAEHADKQPRQESNPIDDAFSKMEKETGKLPGARIGDIDDEFSKVVAHRIEVERERAAAQKAKKEREEAQGFCSQAMKSQETCLKDACGSKPSETICTSSRRDQCNCPKGESCMCFPTFTCISTGSNPEFGKWESCTATAMGQCNGSGAKFSSADACVQQRLQSVRAK